MGWCENKYNREAFHRQHGTTKEITFSLYFCLLENKLGHQLLDSRISMQLFLITPDISRWKLLAK
jgi:hypothetical protein